MLVVFVHGWGVLQADYGVLPAWLQQQGSIQTTDVWLSDYVTYSDDVTVHDLVDAFERARQAAFPNQPFACVTHSTGGPVLRLWLDRFYGSNESFIHRDDTSCPLTHLIMLAPPNHGSALAQLGKSRLSRMKFWLQGAEPGEKVLDCLELGSLENARLNQNQQSFDWKFRGVFLFVLIGNAIDHKLYDHLNSYTGERGSDGVVRCASANLNFTTLKFRQNIEGTLEALELHHSPRTAFGILPGLSHCGTSKGILNSVTSQNAAVHSTAQWVNRCLRVITVEDYTALTDDLENLTAQAANPCSMAIFQVVDSSGNAVEDYDLLLTSGDTYSPDHLPQGFFIDRQCNGRRRNVLTYYLDHSAMSQTRQLGFQLISRPDAGSISYRKAEFTSELATVETVLRPHETVLIDIEIQRHLDPNVFRLKQQ